MKIRLSVCMNSSSPRLPSMNTPVRVRVRLIVIVCMSVVVSRPLTGIGMIHTGKTIPEM